MSEFDRDLNPLLRRVSRSSGGAKDLEDLYERHGIDPSKGPDELANEIRLDGSSTVMGIFRPEGVPYKEVVEDVADKLGIGISDKSSVETIEMEILRFMIKEYWDNFSEEEKDEVIEGIKKIDPNIKGDMVRNAMLVGGMGATIAFRGIIGPLIRAMLAKAAGVAISARLAGMLVPGLNVILGILLVFEIAGPAYRKTVPTVVTIAILRLDHSGD